MEINSGLELLEDLSKQLNEIRLLAEREKLRKWYKVLRRKNKNTADRLGRQYREYRASKIQETTKQIFLDWNDHVLDLTVESNHVYTLMKCIKQCFIKITMHAVARKLYRENYW